ncbi:MAG: MiaB/RimO family radical SAM methylthiotransferase [Verrucomicrobiota bacterium]|nr:MiaB/RimO family radical SAM methylthiotransferase [Limisphaera sp.]MDW8381997.1 MiaB/RimO family radical SAM methylthiotransferase [Verrucomicrobiota bacterium]
MPSVYIKTYGCQMNVRDSEAVAAQLLARGYTLATSEDQADIVLLNTCSVRDHAEQTALNKMRSLAADLRRTGREVILGFLGCMAQSRGEELLQQLPAVDLVLGTQKLHRTADYLDELLRGVRTKVVDTRPEPGSESAIREHLAAADGSAPVTAYVSIMQGCNQHCTFCIVPQTRGPERSRPISDIVAECRQLAARGVKEIMLLGQIVTSYGRRPGLNGRPGWLGAGEAWPQPQTVSGSELSPFVRLLEAVHTIDGIERIRFTAPHPKGYGDDLIHAYGRLPKLVESAHVPVQSGSNRILKLMRRGYTRERFLEIIRKLRAVQPGIGLSTDIIVGFPGETEEDFQQTLALCQEVEFDQVFLFKYSPRRNTPAASMPDALPPTVIEERHARAAELINAIARRRYAAMVGKTVQILVEGPSKKNPHRMMGRTRCNKIVVFEGSPRHRGQLMDVRIVRAGSYTLYGDPAIVGLVPEEPPLPGADKRDKVSHPVVL